MPDAREHCRCLDRASDAWIRGSERSADARTLAWQVAVFGKWHQSSPTTTLGSPLIGGNY